MNVCGRAIAIRCVPIDPSAIREREDAAQARGRSAGGGPREASH